MVWLSVTRLGFSFYFQNETSMTVFTDWAQSGFDAGGSRYNPYENVLSADNVQDLDVGVGSQGWEYSAPGAADFSDPVVGRGYVFIGLDGRGPGDESVYAFNAFQGGQPVWDERRLGLAKTPAFVGGNVIVGTVPDVYTNPSAPSLSAYSSSGGSLVWSMQSSQPDGSPPVVAPPLVADGAVYAIVRPDFTSRSGLIKVDAKTGAPSSSWPNDPVTPSGGSLNRCTPVFSQGKVFVADSNQVYRINAVDGSIEAWTPPLGTIDGDMSPVVSGGVVFQGTSDAGFFAYDTTTMQGKWQWAGASGGNPPAIQCSAAVTKDHVYFTTDETILYALDVKDGTEEWKVRVHSGRTRCWPPAVANGVVFLVTDDTLYAYDAAKGLRKGNPLLVWQYVYQGSARPFTGPPVIANGFAYLTIEIFGSVLVALSLPTRP